jgi:hypothetical protein
MTVFKRKDDGNYAFSTRFWVSTFIAAFFIIWIGYNTQMARERTEKLAQETTEYAQKTNDCLTQLITVLTARAKLTQDNDDLSIEQRRAIFDLIGEAVTPPAELASLPQSDPRYQAWAKQVTLKYYAILANSQSRQSALIEERRNHPIPDPNCGELAQAPK